MSTSFTARKTKDEWDDLFTQWSKPPSQAEQDRCNNAVQQISKAIESNADLKEKNTEVFAQGSYCNRVNVREDSDVDVCSLNKGVFFSRIPQGYDKSQFGIVSADYTYSEYRQHVENALVERFGRSNVRRGNKAFDVNEGGTRVDADVAATFEYRLYYLIEEGKYYNYHSGTGLITDRESTLVTNFPKQQYDNGVKKK